MIFDLSRINNPIIDGGLAVAARDPALIYENGVLKCFYTHVHKSEEGRTISLHVTESRDLVTWSASQRLTTSTLNFSSPGNVIRVGDEWVLCVQSYVGQESRLWLMKSDDLCIWRPPVCMHPQGCQGTWTDSHRQIDPYLVEHDQKYWCFYKTSSKIGLLCSENLQDWQEAVPDRPVLNVDHLPNCPGVENVCVVPAYGAFAMFFAPCVRGRGVGLAYSDDLLNWRDAHLLDFPNPPWSDNKPTAGMVLDLRADLGVWLMAYHDDREYKHSDRSVIALGWSEDLEHWHVP